METKNCLARALVRLGRPDAAQEVYRNGGVPASMRADMALALCQTSPQDTLRLLDGIDDRAKWLDPDGRPQKITDKDLAKASAALEDLQPERATALIERALSRIRGRTNDDKYRQGLLDVLTHAAPTRAAHVLADLAEELRSDDEWPPMSRHSLARAVLRLAPHYAAQLVDQGPPADQGAYRSVDRIAVLAVTAPDLAAEQAARLLDDEDNTWFMDQLAEALIGDPTCSGDPALRPLARRCAREVLTGSYWEDALPVLAELEPEAVLAVHERLRELGVVGAG
ncbi:hypothetical protein ABZ471_41880 [Streptomyces sp. NPDC005728]|uniref:hypothetical protein n=1 Tax=Streptomyces sp. NPDC005728 TaxID=3157054 RepID=UPI0033E76153